jgi:hypothetical protein
MKSLNLKGYKEKKSKGIPLPGRGRGKTGEVC